jgi:hypothetical protein
MNTALINIFIWWSWLFENSIATCKFVTCEENYQTWAVAMTTAYRWRLAAVSVAYLICCSGCWRLFFTTWCATETLCRRATLVLPPFCMQIASGLARDLDRCAEATFAAAALCDAGDEGVWGGRPGWLTIKSHATGELWADRFEWMLLLWRLILLLTLSVHAAMRPHEDT